MSTPSTLKSRSLTEITEVSDVYDDGNYNATTSTILTPAEAESIVESLQSFPVEEIGSSNFLKMYAFQIERLSLQAHTSVQSQNCDGADEFVLDAIVAFNKLDVLVKTLLAIEAWRTFLLDPSCNTTTKKADESTLLLDLIAKNKNSLRCAFTLHAEATLVGLLNLMMYRKERCEAMTSEASIALCDYCARQLTSLAVPVSLNAMVRRQKEPESVEEMTKRIMSRSIKDEIIETRLDTEYKIAVVATSLSRHLCEHIEVLPIGAQTRILDTHDYLVLMVPLIEEPPWTRTRKSSKSSSIVWEKQLDNYEWKEIVPSDLLQITKCEAQCWLAIFHLTCSDLCRKQYSLNEFRKEQLLRIRKFLHVVILDQLPVLRDVMRYMDELSLMRVADNRSGHGSALLLEQVDVFRDSLIARQDWEEVARGQYDGIFSKVTDASDKDLRLIADVYNEENISSVITGGVGKPIFEPLHMPLENISISLGVDGTHYQEMFQLTPKGDGKEIKTPHGRFRRIKLKILEMDHDLIISGNFKTKANILFQGFPGYSKRLSSETALPDGDTHGNSMTRWTQLGSLEEKLVLQLGFNIQQHSGQNETRQISFSLDQAYLSQSLPD